jgi:2-dehydropantoate 2-reductase
MTFDKPIAVIGAGPVGSILAAHLAGSVRALYVVESGPARFEQLQKHGLSVVGRMEVAPQFPTFLPSVADLAGRELGAVFICTKTWSLKTLLPELSKVVDPNALIVDFQNGIGPEEEVAHVFSRERVSRGVVNFAGRVDPDDGRVTMHWFTPPNYIAALDPNTSDLVRDVARLMTGVALTTETATCKAIKKRSFYKTILNSALNALCASVGITMRQAMTMSHTRSLASLLVREGLSVAAAVGYYYGEDSLNEALKYLDRGGDHLPSMWFDLQRGLPTEIDFMNGNIAQIGMMFKNVDVDVNLFFTSMIITHEIKSGVRTPDQIPPYLAGPCLMKECCFQQRAAQQG